MTEMMQAALDLAAAGWAVFPCKWTGEFAKAPLTDHGHLDASRDPDVIRSWWTRWPLAMIGAPVPESMLVVDLDPRNNPTCLPELEELIGPIPETLTAWSGRNDGGRHHYFLRPAGRLTSTRLPAGVDLKVNGYCIVPPSLHPATGLPYRWDQRPAVKLPPELRDLLRPIVRPARVGPFTKAGNPDALVAWVARQTSNVNDAVYWAAKKAARSGVLDQIEEDLVRAAEQAAAAAGKFGEGGGERGTRKTIGSARRWVQRESVR